MLKCNIKTEIREAKSASYLGNVGSKFLNALSAGSKILELGCGSGHDARAMIEAGHQVDPTDGVAEIAHKAEELLGIPVKTMRFEHLNASEAYDAVWANASLLHVPRRDLPAILSKVLAALKPEGVHHATYKRGEKEGRDRHGRYLSYLSSKEVFERGLRKRLFKCMNCPALGKFCRFLNTSGAATIQGSDRRGLP